MATRMGRTGITIEAHWTMLSADTVESSCPIPDKGHRRCLHILLKQTGKSFSSPLRLRKHQAHHDLRTKHDAGIDAERDCKCSANRNLQ